MERTYLAWNLPNWITIVLMASLGIVLFGFVAAGIKQLRGGATASE